MILTIDVGGTKVLVASFSETGNVIESIKFKTPKEYSVFIQQTKEAIAALCKNGQPAACAIALPATLDRKEGVALQFGNLPWENVQVKNDLQDTLSCPIVLENDAKMAALAEAHEVRNDYNRVLYITISTGIGIGLVVNGIIEQSISDAGGHAIKLEHDGQIRSWEEFASGKAIVAQTGKMASEITEEKDWYLVARNIAIGLIDLIVLLSPNCIVIGGGVGSHLDKFHEKLLAELEIFKDTMITSPLPNIVKAQHPEEAVIYGGYLLARQHLHDAS